MRNTFGKCLALALLAGLFAHARANSNGAPAFTSGGPFPGERACTQCHSGSELNSGPGTLELLVNGGPAAEHMYTPGETVSLLVKFSDANAVRVGFQLAVRSGGGCEQPGTLATTTSTAGSSIRVRDGNCNSTSSRVQWATQSRPRTGNAAEFEVAWTAPAESAGPVTVAVAVNGANGDLSPRGDRIYAKQVTIEPAATFSGPPSISENGLLLADIFSRTAIGAPNAIATAMGENFALAGTESSAALDDMGRISTMLDGICVEVSGARAPVFHLLPDQINFQIPAGTGLGSSTVQVIRDCGQSGALFSNSATMRIAAAKPVFFLYSEENGIAALHNDLALVGEENAVPGKKSRPVLHGEVVTLFGTGFGPVEPPLSSGEIATEPRKLAATSVRAMVGEVELPEAHLRYLGAAPSFAGLYQLSLQVSETVPPGTHDFSVIVDGVTSASGPRLVVAEREPPPAVCTANLVVKPGRSCTLEVAGIKASFSVADSGGACVSVPDLGLNLCHDERLDLSLYGASVRKNSDGSWTVVKLP